MARIQTPLYRNLIMNLCLLVSIMICGWDLLQSALLIAIDSTTSGIGTGTMAPVNSAITALHGLDMIRILLGVSLPERISSSGGIFVWKDDRVTPDTQIVSWEFPDLTLVWEHRQWSSQGLEGVLGTPLAGSGGAYVNLSFGAVLYGSEGTLVAHDTDWEVHHGSEVTRHPGSIGQKEHVGNFVDCIRSRAKPNADVEIGYLSTALCHLGNIAYRLRRTLKFDAIRQSFLDDSEANALLGRTYRPPFVLPDKV